MNKIIVGFDPTNIWNDNFFREFIKTLINDVDNYDVYLVSNSADTPFLNNVVSESGIDILNVNQLPSDSAVVARLNTLKTNIYLAEDYPLCNFINDSIPLQLVTNNVTGCQALVLNNVMDLYLVQQKWVTKFDFWQEQILKQYNV